MVNNINNGISNSEKIRLISQGAFGCILRPSISCTGKVLSKKYVSKIQKSDSSTQNEITIGMKLKKYKDYFAPIISSCPISISTISDDIIKQCDVINKDKDEDNGKNKKESYISTRIRYAGKYSLNDYLVFVYKTQHNLFLKTFINSYMDLLKSIHILNKNSIVHMDLKANNIIYDEEKGKPIIIDFGLSFDTTIMNDGTGTMQWDVLKNVFYIYDDYAPWCFEINILNYIMHEMEPKWQVVVLTDEIVTIMCSNFIKKSNLLTSYFPVEEQNELQTRLTQYLSGFVGKPCVDLATELLKSNSTWDNYSLAVIYFLIIKTTHLDEETVMGTSFFKDIVQILKSVIFAVPNERKSVDDIMVPFRQLTGKILKKDKKKIDKSLQKVNTNDEYAQLQTEKLSRMKLHDLHREKIIYSPVARAPTTV